MRPRPLHRPTRTTAAQNRPAACVPRGSAADRARLSDRAGRGVPPAGAMALPAPSRLEIYRAASASFCRRTPPRQNSPGAASICLRHNTGQILPNPEPETGLFQRIPSGDWHSFAITTDNSGTDMYVDGALVASNANFISNTTVAGTDLAIGVDVSPGGIAPYTDGNVGYTSGKIDDVCIYNTALTAREIAESP